jgi:hypothetical protein
LPNVYAGILGVDNVLQFTLVGATGKHITVNRHQHPSLFWALRGGGGGSWGVVTSVTYRTRPVMPMIGAFIYAQLNTTEIFKKLLREVLRVSPTLTDAGWGGYGISGPFENQPSLAFFVALPNATAAHANKTITPLLEYAQSLASEGSNVITYVQPFNSFVTWYDFIFNTSASQVGGSQEVTSRLLSRSVLEEQVDEVTETFAGLPGVTWKLVLALSSIEHCRLITSCSMIAGGAVSRVHPDDAGLHPGWRTAVLEVVAGISWPEGTPAAQIERLRTYLKGQTALLAKLSSFTYFNEVSPMKLKR